MIEFFVLLLIICLVFDRYECYENSAIYANRLLGAAKHVRLDKFNRVTYVSVKPPLPKTGESRCYTVNCPSWIPSDGICYRCN